MRAIVQRVSAASVEVGAEVAGRIGRGLCVFVGAGKGDGEADVTYCADKIAGLRVFPDDAGKMSRSVQEIGGGVLAIPQFTVYGDVRRGRRPSFDGAMPPLEARAAFDRLVDLLLARAVLVKQGVFGAHMRVLVDNDGPVSILLDSKKLL